MSEIMNCPFCGGEARIMLEEEDRPDECFHNIYCTSCGVQFWVKSKSEAIAAWNRRAQPENARQHALQTGVCPMCEDCPDGCPVETPNDSRNRPENEPLTLSELRGMGGEPVWIQESAPYTFAGYKILCSPVVDEYEDVCFEGGDCYYSHDYGKTWLAYRTKPERSEG